MNKIILLIALLISNISAQFNANILPITPQIQKRMIEGNSWRSTCPVSLSDLRYINVNHWNFNGETVSGEIIVHKDVANEVVYIFEELYNLHYPIRQMRLVSDFKANDWKSIDADNTSAFNCRVVTGDKKKWSRHAYGKAIDINPLENPYISKTGHISHKGSLKYRKRVHRNNTYSDQAVLLKYDKATQVFKKYGWRWGGDWKYTKDYQHFSK